MIRVTSSLDRCALWLSYSMSAASRLQIAPKDDEQKVCEQFTGRVEDLSPPEQFLITMSTVPRLPDKINVLILMKQFQASQHFATLLRFPLMRPVTLQFIAVEMH